MSVHYHCFREEMSPIPQPEPPLARLEAITSCPITHYMMAMKNSWSSLVFSFLGSPFGSPSRWDCLEEGCKREILCLAFPQLHSQPQVNVSTTACLSFPFAKEPSKHRVRRERGFESLMHFLLSCESCENPGTGTASDSCYQP